MLKRMQNGSRLEYVSVDVRDQHVVWRKAQEIGDREKRMDVCVAAAGILKSHTDCLTYPAEQFKEVGWFDLFPFENLTDCTGSKVMDVNTNGVLYTAQAAGQQMLRFGNRGSITNKVGVSLHQSVPVGTKITTTSGSCLGPANQRSSKWHVAWLVSSAQRIFASTLSLLDICALRN